MSGEFPASGFLQLARLVEAEGEVFQYHVLDLLREMKDDAEFHHNAMDTLYQKMPAREIEYFIESLPPADGYAAAAAHVKDIVKLTGGLAGAHFTPLQAGHVIAAELLHRKRWEKVMEENPGTLQALKDRMG